MDLSIENRSLRVKAALRGAELKSIQLVGKEYLWQGDARWWQGSAPVLFPIVGALRNGQTEIDGKSYRMPRHGFAHRLEFQLVERTETSLAFVLEDNEKTRRHYPFSFSLMVTYQLQDNALVTEYSVKNPGAVPLPYCVGGHPGFRVPLDPSERFEDWRLEFEKRETADCPFVFVETGEIDFSRRRRILTDSSVLPLRHTLFEQDALIFDGLQSNKVRLVSGKSGHGVEMDFTGFPLFAVWSSPNGAPFVALEPWRGCGDVTGEDCPFLKKRHMHCLEPGGVRREAFTIRFF